MSDDWFDAFHEADFEGLEELDEAVERVVARLPQARPLGRRLGGLAGGLALAAAVGLWVGGLPSSSEAGGVPARLPSIVTDLVIERVEIRPTPAPVAEPPAITTRPGLWTEGAGLSLDGDAALLISGWLRYRHDDGYEPGVRRVRLPELGLEIRPVGTDFSVVAKPGVAAVFVAEGTVELWTAEERIATAVPGEEWVVVPSTGSDSLSAIATSGLDLWAVKEQLPESCGCRHQDVVSAVAEIRLTDRGSR